MGLELLGGHAEHLCPVGPGIKMPQGSLDRGHARRDGFVVVYPGEVDSDARPVPAWTEPKTVGRHGADLADIEGPGQIEPGQRGDRFRAVLAQYEVLALLFVADAWLELGPEVREPQMPRAGVAELLGRERRILSGNRVQRGCRGSGTPGAQVRGRVIR
jgi:hypothetical protein